jgi:hypothetical protein
VVSAFCKIINWLIYGFVTHAAARRAHIVSDVSKLEDWLMAHFEATLMHITNNHFKTFFRASCGFTGPKTPKIRPKKGPKSARRCPREVETPFWYQTKALHEHSLNKLFLAANNHTQSVHKCQKHDFWLKNSYFQTHD